MKKLFLFLMTLSSITISTAIAGNIEITVRLKKGDIITGKTNLSKILITTAYGVLTIPVERITDIRFGLLSDHTKDGAILPDLSKLQTLTNEAEAKIVYERVLAYGTPVLATIISYTQNPFYSIPDRANYTIEQLIDELYKRGNIPAGQSANDAITFDGSNYIEGAISFSDISIQSEYGNLVFKREKIESLTIAPIDDTPIGKDGLYKLKANYNISGSDNNKGWLNTGILVKNGDKFSINATGKIVLKSLTGGVYNPDGYLSGVKDASYTDDMPIKYGAVVFKIGDYGTVQQAGSQFDGVANLEGNIYISIYETLYNSSNIGYYNVKVIKK